METKKQAILEKVAELFMRYGIKSVTMDDVAKALKMSKKTLYTFVSDKGDLVRQVMAGHCDLEMAACELIRENNLDNAMDELLEITKFVTAQIKNVHPSIHYDLEKYYPEAWGELEKHKLNYIYGTVVDNLNRGIEQGFYRENVNTAIIARLYVYKLDMFFDPEIFPPKEYNFLEVYMEMMRYHIRGVASKKGLEYLEKKAPQEKLNFN